MAAQDAKSNLDTAAAATVTATATCTCTCAAVCYLDNHNELERPAVKVVHDRTYSMQRYLSSQASPYNHQLRPELALRTQVTELQSRERMATVIVALVEKLPKPKD